MTASGVLNPAQQTVTFQGRSIRLRRSELKVLQYFVTHCERVVTVTDLLDGALRSGGRPSAARHQICEIRKKLKSIDGAHLLITEWGRGYRAKIRTVASETPDPSMPGTHIAAATSTRERSYR